MDAQESRPGVQSFQSHLSHTFCESARILSTRGTIEMHHPYFPEVSYFFFFSIWGELKRPPAKTKFGAKLELLPEKKKESTRAYAHDESRTTKKSDLLPTISG